MVRIFGFVAMEVSISTMQIWILFPVETMALMARITGDLIRVGTMMSLSVVVTIMEMRLITKTMETESF